LKTWIFETDTPKLQNYLLITESGLNFWCLRNKFKLIYAIMGSGFSTWRLYLCAHRSVTRF